MAETSPVLSSELSSWQSGPREEGLDLHSLLEVFRKRRLILVWTVAIGIALAAAICVFMTPRYDAVDTLNINPQGGASIDLGELSDLMSGAGGLDWDSIVQTQVLIISSDPLAWDVIKKLRLDQDATFMHPGLLDRFSHCRLVVTPSGQSPDNIPNCQRYKMLQRFSKALDVEALPKTQAVQIRFRSPNPALAASVVNTLAESYLQYNFLTRYNATMKASGFLQDRLNEMRRNMETAESNLAAYQKQANIIGTDETDNLAISQLTDMGKQLTDAEADRILKEANYRLALTGNPELIGTIVPDSVLPTLRSQEAQLDALLAQAQSEYGSKYPKVIQLQSQLGEVRKSLQAETADIQARFKSEFDAAQHTEDNLKQSVDSLKQEAFVESAKFDRYDLLKNEVTSTQDLYDDLLKKLDEAGVTAGLKSTNVDVIAPAVEPVKATLPNDPIFLLVGLAGGLLFGVIGIFIADNLDHSIRGSEEAQELSSLPVIGLLPHLPASAPRTAAQLSQTAARLYVEVLPPGSEFSEAIRSLRTTLLLAAPGTAPKVIMLTSPLPGEGKSLISLNLAATLARAGRRVILIDADLRRGKLLRQREGDLTPGLSGCLTGATTWRDQVQSIPIETGELSVLQSGLRPPNPAELLGSSQMAAMIEELRAKFDHIVIDTAPAAIVTDPIVLSRLADVVLIIARVNRTTRFALKETIRSLSRISGRVAGIVLNDDDVAKRYYGYGSYKRYYSYYVDGDSGENHSHSGPRHALKRMD
jgi:succinoglycan biosynthesis transport protein ExoP